jgi:hypothetical protein
VFLKAHAGDPLRIDRVGRPAEYVRLPRLTLGLTVQRDVLRGLAALPSLRGRGLLARFLYALPESLLGRRDTQPQPVPAAVRAAYVANIESLLRLVPARTADDAPCPHVVPFSGAAQERMQDFLARLEPQLGPDGDLGHVADWGGKLGGVVARVAGLLHAATHRDAPWCEAIQAGSVAAAITLAEYLIAHARAAFAEMGADPDVESARHVLRWLERQGTEAFTRRDAYQGTKGRFKTVAALDPALRLLAAHDFVRERPAEDRTNRAGRKPSPIYDVNPLGADCGNCGNCGNGEAPPGPAQPARRRVTL